MAPRPFKFRLYWSNLKKYEECPQKFLWSRGWEDIDVGGGPGRKKPIPEKKSRHHAVMGIVIQSSLETFYNDELWRHPQGLQERLVKMTKAEFKRLMSEEYIDWRSSPPQDELERTCISGVTGYLKTMKKHKFLGPYAKSEVKLTGWLDQYTEIGGYADMIIRRDDSGITILDGKNSKTKLKYTDPDQLRWYALCFLVAYGKLPDRLAFVWYRYPYDEESEETGIDWVDFTKRDLQELAKRGKEVRKLMHFRKFQATPSSKSCQWCDYESICPERKEMKARNRAKRPQKALPIVDNAEGFVEFGIDSAHASEKKSKPK